MHYINLALLFVAVPIDLLHTTYCLLPYQTFHTALLPIAYCILHPAQLMLPYCLVPTATAKNCCCGKKSTRQHTQFVLTAVGAAGAKGFNLAVAG